MINKEGNELSKRIETTDKIFTINLMRYGNGGWRVVCTTTANDNNYSRLLARFDETYDTWSRAHLAFMMCESGIQVARELGAEIVIGEEVK